MPSNALESGFIQDDKGELTHYSMCGPVNGWPTLILHGATVASWEFDPFCHELAGQQFNGRGFRILRLDLYGHGYSSRSLTPAFSLQLFVDQALSVLDKLGWHAPIFLLGHSLGAAVSCAVARQRANRIRQLSLFAPMLNYSRSNPLAAVMRTAWLGEIFMHVLGLPLLRKRRRIRYRRIGVAQLAELFVTQSRLPGFANAMCAMERDGALGDQSARYRALAELELGIPTNILWGDQDSIIKRDDISQIRQLVGEHQYHQMPNLAHNFIIDAPKPVVAAFLRGLSSITD